MASEQIAIENEIFQNNKPVFEDIADSIMSYMESLSPMEIASILGISNQLAIKSHNLAYDFPHKKTGYKALYGFTGEAYKGLDVKSLTQEAIDNANNNLRIISSIYGLLKPTDIIKPYRCEFNKAITPNHKTAIQTFKPKATIEFVKLIKDNKIQDVINLLPGDADKCLDWKIIRSFTKVHKIVFQTIDSNGKLKSPIAKRLKELRGLLARQIFSDNIKTFKELTTIESAHYIFSPKDSKPLLPVFISTD